MLKEERTELQMLNALQFIFSVFNSNYIISGAFIVEYRVYFGYVNVCIVQENRVKMWGKVNTIY